MLWLDLFIDSYSNESQFNQHHNHFLQGNYAPVDVEHNNLELIPLTGQIPSDISGVFLRIGPNPIQKHIGNKKLHRFDGHGMIHSIRIRKKDGTEGAGNITYSNQYIQTPRYLIEKQHNQNIFLNEGEKKGIVGIFKLLVLLPLKLKFFGLSEVTSGPANMNIVVLGSRIYACHEGSLPYALHWNENNTFDSVGYELSQTTRSSTATSPSTLSLPITSHPKVDIKTQTMYFTGFTNDYFNRGPDRPSALYGSAYGTHSLQMIDHTEVTLPSQPWIHDMLITEHYVLLFCGSIVTNSNTNPASTGSAAGSGGRESGIPIGSLFTFDTQVKFEIGVATKDDADFIVGESGRPHIQSEETDDATLSKSLQWFRGLNSAAIMHAANAWEETNAQNHIILILWAPICEDPDFDGTFLKKPNSFHMSRVALNLQTGQMRKGTLGTEYNVDYPMVHPAYQGYRSKYIFASILDTEAKEPIGIIKYNVFDKIIANTIYFSRGIFSGEMVPLPKHPNAKNEDKNDNHDNNGVNIDSDGSDALYLISFFFNSGSNTSEWHIYDGESMASSPLATFQIPVRVPYGFHGEWIKDEVLQSIINDF